MDWGVEIVCGKITQIMCGAQYYKSHAVVMLSNKREATNFS